MKIFSKPQTTFPSFARASGVAGRRVGGAIRRGAADVRWRRYESKHEGSCAIAMPTSGEEYATDSASPNDVSGTGVMVVPSRVRRGKVQRDSIEPWTRADTGCHAREI
jgi:hypothetical protein